MKRCTHCGGRGFLLGYVEQGSAMIAVPEDQCERCEGSGEIADTPQDVLAKAFEEACMGISVGFDADEMNATIGDAIAHYRHESDLSGARDLIYDQSGDAAADIEQALSDAGFVIVPKQGHGD